MRSEEEKTSSGICKHEWVTPVRIANKIDVFHLFEICRKCGAIRLKEQYMKFLSVDEQKEDE